MLKKVHKRNSELTLGLRWFFFWRRRKGVMKKDIAMAV